MSATLETQSAIYLPAASKRVWRRVANLLNNAFTEIGVGIATAGQGYYFVVDFGSR